MIKAKVLPFVALVFSQSLLAQQPPNAGSQLQQIPPSPISQRQAPAIRIVPSADAQATGESAKITVQSLTVTGVTIYSPGEMVAQTGFKPGSELTLSDLRAMATEITRRYRSDGYFVAQAYVPEQDIVNGAVTIAVVEGQYGQVVVHNNGQIPDDIVYGKLAGISSGDPIVIGPLESRLLLLSDLPGVKVSATLAPGAKVGASDLIVDLSPGQPVTGSIDVDNAGNRYTGEYRLGATVNLNNLAGRGDVASLRAMTSGPGLKYARASYQMPFGKATGGVAYSWLGYRLGQEFEPLGAQGTATVASVYGSYPLIRSRENNLTTQVQFENRTFQDRMDSTASVVDKSAQVLMASLRGDHWDSLGGRGQTSYALTASAGNLDIKTAAMRDLDAATAKTQGQYSKVAYSLSRTQGLTESLSLYAGINGQFASKNLDTSEKMELGGMNAVRAYPEGEAYADEGYVLTLEARVLLPKFSQQQPGDVHLIGFVDTGSVTVNKQPWAAGDNQRTLSGAGVGLTWSEYNNFLLRVYYARTLGSEVAASAPDKSGRVWFQAVKYF